MVMAFPWKNEMLLLVLSILGVFAKGKAFGGVVADRIGFRTTAIFSRSCCSHLVCASWEIPVMGTSVYFSSLLCPLRWHLWQISCLTRAPRLDWPVSH